MSSFFSLFRSLSQAAWWRFHARRIGRVALERRPGLTSFVFVIIEILHFLPLALVANSWVLLGFLVPGYESLTMVAYVFHVIFSVIRYTLDDDINQEKIYGDIAAISLTSLFCLMWGQEVPDTILLGVIFIYRPALSFAFGRYFQGSWLASFYEKFMTTLYGHRASLLDFGQQDLNTFIANSYFLETPTGVVRGHLVRFIFNAPQQAQDEQALLEASWSDSTPSCGDDELTCPKPKRIRF